MLDDKTDKYLDKLWIYFKNAPKKSKDAILQAPDKSPLALSYLLLLFSLHHKDFPAFLRSISPDLDSFLTEDTINNLVKKAALITDIHTIIKSKKSKVENPEAVSVIRELGGKVQVNRLIKFIVGKYFMPTQEDSATIDPEFAGLESKYIEIYESSVSTIDYSLVESMFSTTEVKNGLAEAFYQMIIEQEQPLTMTSVERKINKLFEKQLIIPITDEFLRYHKDTERIDTSESTKKIDKIRYMVSKLHQIMDMYSKDPKQSPFYPPLINKKVVLYNDTDEINSIMKLVKMGKTAIRSNENFSDLVHYRSYPYLNFHDFKNYGFKLKINHTCDAIRSANFEYPENAKAPLQWRVASQDATVNIVGLALPRFIGVPPSSPHISNKLQCVNVRNTKNLHDIYKNGYDVFVKKLERLVIDNQSYKKTAYWIFNKDTDKLQLSEFNEINELNFEHYFKLMTGSLYDKIAEMGYFRLKQHLQQDMSIYDAILHIDRIEKTLVPLTDYMPYIYHDVIYDKTKKYTPEYDTNEDKIPGLNTKIKQVPRVKKENDTILKITIPSTSSEQTVSESSLIPPNSVCQHIVTWNTIKANKTSDKYNQMLFEFVKRYIRDNAQNEYVCKSCYQVVDLKKYIHDYSSSTEGVSMSFALESQLDKLPEYDKFNRFIKYMDKIIERFAYVADIAYYLGNLPQIKLRRQEIIRQIIDFVNIQHLEMKDMPPNKRGEREKRYGITKDFNIFFVFELKNEIITYSSKDTDKYKNLKRKNIYVYMALFIIADFNTTQIYNLDDIVKYADFVKVMKQIFGGLLITVNNSGVTKPITEYPLLCYAIYTAAHVLIKSKLWTDEPKLAMRFIANTMVDTINTILEISTKPEKDYRYELFATRFFSKLNNTFSNKKLFDAAIASKKNKTIVTYQDIPLTGKLQEIHFDDTIPVAKPAVNFIHKTITRPDALSLDEQKKMEQLFYSQYLFKLFNIYKLDGTKRPESSIPSEQDLKNVTMQQLELMYDNIMKKKKVESNKAEAKLLSKKKQIEDDRVRIQEVTEKHTIKSSLFDVVEGFIKKVEAIIGVNVNINNNNIFLTKNVYTITFDYKGNRLKEPLIIHEGDKNMTFKKNDQVFKSDVYVMQDLKSNISMYYHGKHLYFIGYRDSNGKINKSLIKDAYLHINYSVMNKLMFLGLPNLYIDMDRFADTVRNRISNLKSILLEIQKLIYQVKNRYKHADPAIKEYIAKFKTLDVVEQTSDGEERKVFGGVYDIINGSFYDASKKVSIDDKLTGEVYARYLLKHDNTDHNIIKYICSEMSRLLDINVDKYNKINLGFLLVTIINKQFNKFYISTLAKYNNDVKLSQLLSEYDNIQVYDDDDEIVDRLITEQDEEARIDNQEEAEALDAQQDTPDAADDMGDEDVVFMPDY